MDIDSENRWAVYPIEKIEAAMAHLNEAIVMARAAQNEIAKRKRQVQDLNECELDKILCRGCHDELRLEGTIEPIHIWLDGSSTERCTATAERKQELREYFQKEMQRGNKPSNS